MWGRAGPAQLGTMAFFAGARDIDARYSTFNSVSGHQIDNYYSSINLVEDACQCKE